MELSPLAKRWFEQMTQANSPGGWTITPEEAEKVIGPALADGVTYDEYVALTQVLDRSEANERAILCGLNRWTPQLTNALRKQFNNGRVLKDADLPSEPPFPNAATYDLSKDPNLPSDRPSTGANLHLEIIPSPISSNSSTIELSNATWKFRIVVEHEPPRDEDPWRRKSLLDRERSDSVRVFAFHNGTLVTIDPYSARELGKQCESLIDQFGTSGKPFQNYTDDTHRALVLKAARILQGPPSLERITWRLHHSNKFIREVGYRDVSAITDFYFSPKLIPWMQTLIEDPRVDDDAKFSILYSWAQLTRNGYAEEYGLTKPAIIDTLHKVAQHGAEKVQNVALLVLIDLHEMSASPK